MKFKPCIDVHNGKVKQIVGGSLADSENSAKENFVSEKGGEFYAKLYKERGVSGGHIILLNPASSEYYSADKTQALAALNEYPGGLQVGGGITPENAAEFLENGASHVIVTSYVFKDGKVNRENLEKISSAVGKNRLVIDLSCRKRDGEYYIVTDRWQKFTNVRLNRAALDMFAEYCAEFLVHAVDVEGKARGVEIPLAETLGQWDGIPITYAGGIGSYADLDALKQAGGGKLDFTVGSALDISGGTLDFEKIC
ncbi:MAG: phosphoribosylformimino-5-aminoimidazole carboxamide ribotide isomerase, partial [Muribaculaceae bacterium]|nr:phosphoribosylformimino-5-aminoimidazole carboxamide ribotide isomerase [Muribaculaceae bacterium]